MPSLHPASRIKEYQDFINRVYGLQNDRYFSMWDMMSNIERFTMRGLKGIRKGDREKTKINLVIALSWFMSVMNRLHIDLEEEVWKRFPFICSYCASSPCNCKKEKIETRQKLTIDESRRPRSIREFQLMFEQIYPHDLRTIEHAGVHLAEELGEFSEAFFTHESRHGSEDFDKIMIEAADFFSCIVGVFNSIGLDLANELSLIFGNNCHVCKKAPCECNFSSIVEFRS
jgi:NTP pyrophosphatase (non-canonical NTP hydrolase)